MNQSTKEQARVVTQAEWIAARKELLVKEKNLTRQRDALAEERSKLPWVKVDKKYEFETASGKKTLAQLFGGASQMAIYHFMFGPDWEQGCPSCSLLGDHMDGMGIHLAQRDVKLTMVSRAPLARIEEFKKRMGWKFPWVSSYGSEFNFDFGVSVAKEELGKEQIYNYSPSKFPSEERPGLSVFYKSANGEVFHTYSMYGRGLEDLKGMYMILDRVPKGRDEGGLSFPMAWVRHHDRYPESNIVEVKAAKT
ncbi:MAG: thioredoxin family protein [Candidatus Acidiferrum sp.]